jgi:hypothetical protein
MLALDPGRALRLSGGATGGEQAMTDARIELLANVPEEHLPEALAALSPATYEMLRQGLAQRLGFRVSALDRMYKQGVSQAQKENEEIEGTTTPRKSQVTRLIEIAQNLALFHDKEGHAYAELAMMNHREVWPVQSKAFKDWLSSEHYLRTGTGCNRNSISDALTTIEARAKCYG